MTVLSEIVSELLLEQDTKIDILSKAIGERIPVSIYYRGPLKKSEKDKELILSLSFWEHMESLVI